MSNGISAETPSFVTDVIVFLIVLLLILILLAWRLRKNRRGRFRSTVFVLSLCFAGMTTVILAWVIYNTLPYYGIPQPLMNYEQSWKDIPLDKQKIAEDYIISIIGKNNFDGNFIYEKKKSFYSTFSGYYTDYSVAYHYLPLRKFTSDDIVLVQLRDNTPQWAVGIPSCAQDQSKCQFNVTKDQALRIARENDFEAPDLNVTWNPNLNEIEVQSCKINKVMDIDYRDGKVINFKPEILCGGVE